MSAAPKCVGTHAFAKNRYVSVFHRPPKVRSTALSQNPCQINGLAKYVVNYAFHPRIAVAAP